MGDVASQQNLEHPCYSDRQWTENEDPLFITASASRGKNKDTVQVEQPFSQEKQEAGPLLPKFLSGNNFSDTIFDSPTLQRNNMFSPPFFLISYVKIATEHRKKNSLSNV
jgi:hypothetical protein